MCDACVMKTLGERLGRRGILAAIALAAAAPTAMAQPVRASRVVEMTHVLSPDFPTFGGDPAIQVERVMNIARDGYNLNRITHGEHVGTHFDAPLHFSANGAGGCHSRRIAGLPAVVDAPPRPTRIMRRHPRMCWHMRRRMAASRPAPVWR